MCSLTGGTVTAEVEAIVKYVSFEIVEQKEVVSDMGSTQDSPTARGFDPAHQGLQG